MEIKFTILGCGYSLGIPRIDGSFGNCDPKNKKNYRTRCSALVTVQNHNILIDTSPDIKSQLIRNKVKNIDKIFYTHPHADQTHGINDLRFFYIKNRIRIDVYADNLKQTHRFKFKNKKIELKSIKVQHGRINSIGYIINNKCGYISDVSKIYDHDLKKIKKLKYLVIDCLRYEPHYSHFNLNDVLKLVEKIKPKQTILTNLNSEMDYSTLKRKLPKHIIPAYDGLSFIL